MQPKSIARLAQEACEDKKGIDVLLLDIRKLASFTDFFIIASGTSDRHVRALADHVVESLEQRGITPHHIEGLQTCRWVLLDYAHIIVHLFHHETRQFYHLERLWGDARPLT